MYPTVTIFKLHKRQWKGMQCIYHKIAIKTTLNIAVLLSAACNYENCTLLCFID